MTNYWLYIILGAAVAVSTYAMLIAVRSARIARMEGMRISRERKQLDLLSTDSSDLRGSLDALRASHKRLVSRLGMADMRARRASGESAPPESAPPEVKKAYWRRRLRLTGPDAAIQAQRIHRNGLPDSDDASDPL